MNNDPQDLSLNRAKILAEVTIDGSALKFASQEFCADKHIVLEAVKQNGVALYYAADELKADHDVAAAAIG